MLITALPTPPSRQDPANFAARGDALLTALPGFVTEANALQTDVNAKQAAATDSAAAAAASEGVAIAKEVLATASANTSTAQAVIAAAQANTALSSKDSAVAQAAAAVASAAGAEAARVAAIAAQAGAVAVVTGGTGSLIAAPGKLPIADAGGRLDKSWYAALQPNAGINDIGIPGTAGFGVGICPAPPAGYTAMAGCTDVLSANYGNYQYSDGSVMVWIPAFYMRLADAGNATYGAYGVNSISIKAAAVFPDDATANAQGYWRHRAFVNAGANQLGFFRDKYDCSNNAGTASSIYNAMPLVSGPAADQVGFNVLTGAPANAYYGSIPAAKTRGAKFFPESVFIADALCRISTAQAQASSSATYCAWYDAAGVKNFPKGNNNNALKDGDDLTVTFTSAGSATYPNFAKTGSGLPFAKTTHNGQACGITDVNGNIYKINPGMTCIATSKAITGATQANPVVLTVVGHGYATGQIKQVVSAGGMTQINDRFFVVTVVDADHVTLDGVDGTAFGAWTAGGSVNTGTFYTLKPSVDIAAVTSGAALATDHWGATGVAAQFDVVTMNFATAYPNNGNAQRYGNGANAVFDMSTANGRALAMLGMPAANGMSVAGSNAMGLDYFYQYIRDQLCVISRGLWSVGGNAGSRNRALDFPRTYAYYFVGFACASYL